MKKLFIPVFCLLHMAAIFWWTLPNSFGGMVLANAGQASLEARLFKWMMLDNNRWGHAFLQSYIDVTGSQQYWDFFRHRVQNSINTCLFGVRLLRILHRE